jgi:ADP-ribose pyrophosphatase YjhB (NUDIX family)
MEMNFCRRCGKPLTHLQDHIYKCADGHTIYANCSPAVGIFFVSPDNKKVLLATRGIEPDKGMLDALGGFLDGKETFEKAAVRELREELSLEPEDYESLIYLTSDCDDYRHQGEFVPFATVLFWSRLITKKSLQASDDVASVGWYPLATVAPEELHTNDIRQGIFELQKLFGEVVN